MKRLFLVVLSITGEGHRDKENYGGEASDRNEIETMSYLFYSIRREVGPMYKHLIKIVIGVIFCWIGTNHAANPVLTEFKIDTSLYENYQNGSEIASVRYARYFPGPLVNIDEAKAGQGNMVVFAFLKKNSDQIDLFSYNGKCGTVTIPNIRDTATYWYPGLWFSQTFIDADPEWECLVLYSQQSVGSSSIFKLYDNDGKELLADTGRPSYGFDGNSTYIVQVNNDYTKFSIKSWRFRTNVLSNESLLRKSTATARSPMQLFGVPDGGYRVNLQPSSGGQTELQLFDLAGRCVFSKVLESVKAPMSFTIPEQNIPNSPFIAKVRNNQGSFVEKKIPVR